MNSNESPRPYRLGLLQGDGIGPEIVPASVQVMDTAVAVAGAMPIEWTLLPLGHSAIDSHGSAVPASTLTALDGMDAWLLGPHDRSRLNPSGTIRKHFDLFANIRPAMALDDASAIVPGTDLVIVRENTQGFYADRSTYRGTGEFMPSPDVAIAMGIITRDAVERIAGEAFELARRRRCKVTVVHKANVLRLTTGLFHDVCLGVAADYPDVAVDDYHIDAMAARLVRRADEFDVVVTENMFGDILSDLAGEVAGSLGIAPSINTSADRAMAQAAHGSAPDIAGRDIANPTAMILSGAMLLDWLGVRHADDTLRTAAGLIRRGLIETMRFGTATPDMGGTAGTRRFSEAVAETVAASPSGPFSGPRGC
jgi:3-isopropylmalate dehydrogenase